MDRLPIEVSSQIFNLLHLQDKLECVLVSKSWKNMVHKSRLFHTLRLSNSNVFSNLYQRLIRQDRNVSQITCLIIDVDMEKEFDLNLITNHLPHLRTFYFNETSKKPLRYQLQGSQSWYRYVETIIDDNESSIASSLFFYPITATDTYNSNNTVNNMTTNTTTTTTTTTTTNTTNKYPYLKTLSINAQSIPTRHMMNQLSNAPVLSHLTLDSISVTFLDLELLHSNAPLLHYVDLKTTNLPFSQLPTHIQPVDHVTTFSLTFMDTTNIDIQTQWLQYIRQKYINMLHFSYFDFLNGHMNGDVPTFQTNALIPLLQQRGPQLKSFAIASDILPLHFMTVLDQAGSQIQDFHLRTSIKEIYHYFDHSKQLASIQSFRMYALTLDVYPWISQMTSLKELVIFYFVFPADPGLRLDHLLDNCHRDTLESLVILVRNIQINTGVSYHPNIKKLTLSGTILPFHFDDYLSRSFPNVHYLKFNLCHFKDNRFCVPHLHLSHFELVITFPSKQSEQQILVVTKNGEERKWYVFRSGYHGKAYYEKRVGMYEPPCKILPFEAMNHDPSVTFTLICASVMNVIVLSEINGDYLHP